MYCLVRISERCNLNCIGCYASSKYAKGKVLDLDNVDEVINALGFLHRAYRVDRVVLHGKEPLMANIYAVDKLLKFIRKKINLRCKPGIQTNLTLLNEKWIELFKKYDMSISSSYRGYESLFDTFTGVKGSYEAFKKSVNMLYEHNLRCSFIIYYPTNLEDVFLKNVEKIADDLYKNFKATSVSINEFCPSKKIPPNKHYADFVIKFQEYIMKKNYPIKVRPIYELYKTLTGEYRLTCAWRHNCLNFKVINLDGTVGNCNRNFKYYKPVFKECLNCKIYGICYGLCSADIEAFGGKLIPEYCEGRKKLVDYVYNNLNRLREFFETCDFNKD